MTPKPSSSNTNTCTQHHHTPSATLDILILILVLFSGTFLLTSYFSYIFHTVSLLLPSNFSFSRDIFNFSSLHFLAVLGLVLLLVSGFELFCGKSKRKCGKKGCKGLKKALEFDLQLQSEEMLRAGGKGVREVEELPWKGGTEGNGDYECLRSELRKMAPVNGRAVLLFRLKCGCAVAKLEGWGPKRGRRNKK
ncbi:putative ribosomal protein L34e superfamily protein [Tanacetum coccineum]